MYSQNSAMNSSDRSSEFDPYGAGHQAPEDLSALDLLDRTIASLPIGDPIRKALLNIRAQIADQEDTINEARQTIEKMEEVIKKVTSPANRIGTISAARTARPPRSSWAARIIIAT